MVSYRKASTSFTKIILLCSFILLSTIIINSTNDYLSTKSEQDILRNKWFPWLEPDFHESIWNQEDVECNIPKGTVHKTSKNLKLILSGNYSQQEYTILFRLLQMQDSNTVKILNEEYRYVTGPPFRELWYVKLPPEYPAEYSIGVIAYDQSGELVYGQVNSIDIPHYELDAELYTIPKIIKDEKSLKIVLFNKGQGILHFGEPYTLEKNVDGVWEEEATQLIWITVGHLLEQGGKYSQKIDLKHLDSGIYRVSKHVELEFTSLEETLFAEFTVERSPDYVFPEPPRHIQYEISGYYYRRDKPVFKIWNTDYRDIYINNTYVIEALSEEQWTHFYTNRSDIIDVIKWGKIWELRITELELAVGEYRLIFQMGVEDSEEIETVTIPFTVKPRKPQRLPH